MIFLLGCVPLPSIIFRNPPELKCRSIPSRLPIPDTTSTISPMPWPATHILTAETAYPAHFSHLRHADFVLGTVFPDIRYPAKIDRDLTHIHEVTLSEMGQESSFRAGLLFHTYVDDFWNGYIRNYVNELSAVIPLTRPAFHALKILQDIYLYQEFDRWADIAGWLDTILEEELTFGASEDLVRRWHQMLQSLLSKPPEDNDLSMLTLSLSVEVVQEIRRLLAQFRELALVEKVLKGFYPKIKADLLDNVTSAT